MTQTATRVTLPVLRALLDQARRKDYRSGVLGVRARPEWTAAPTFTHADVQVRVMPCVSALAVREALLERVRGQWLVVLTDRPDEDLGAGVLSHLVWHRLRTPDPWDAVRDRFAASGIDPALTATADDREIAVGLLAAAPPSGWPPAPGGVLTRDHAMSSVAAAHLELTDPVIDATSVLAWTADPALMTRVADLRGLAGDALAGSVLGWAAGRAGLAGRPLLHLLRTGEARDAVPLGLVAGLLSEDGAVSGTGNGGSAGRGPEAMQLAREGLIRLEPRLGGAAPPAAVLRSWAAESATVIAGMLQDPASRGNGESLLARADELLAASLAAGLADGSDLLPSGLTRRFAALAGA
ncbi:MAG TPA: BREX-2 system phosphatase PglZ, partial [Streptosporangiaceae bacterium]|nr:BREX-2 system phosphatase PglZ [Streptosporangiaceae bacterium]